MDRLTVSELSQGYRQGMKWELEVLGFHRDLSSPPFQQRTANKKGYEEKQREEPEHIQRPGRPFLEPETTIRYTSDG